MNAGQTHKYTNSLAKEQSPYLIQHSNNPVNWHPWGDEAFNRAKKEDKLIFLSIGYSTCHWCHVMESESFENEKVAKILNDNYVSIKVDREEMPHIDKYYQNVYQLLNQRSGGWPLNVILTPQIEPFFAATYIPPQTRNEYLGIQELLSRIHTTYSKQKDKITNTSQNIQDALKRLASTKNKTIDINLSLVDDFINDTKKSYDEENGGIGFSPKFPRASTVETLLDIYTIFGNTSAKDMATHMLTSMAQGGIYDQIEGGFYRYSVDEKWQIPHFEKMLYTNAELLSAYSKAYIITSDKLYKQIAKEIVLFVENRFEDDNVLYSASDADSMHNGKKEEGAYYVFDYKESKAYLSKQGLSKKEVDEILDYFNISDIGNFENNTNNPYLEDSKKIKNLQTAKNILTKLRAKKQYPFVDKKILTSWNAMFISSLFELGKIENDYNKKAITHLEALLAKLYINKTLYHQTIDKQAPKTPSLFEDYSFLIESLLKAYDYSLESKYLDLASTLYKESKSKFYKDKQWYMNTSSKHTKLEVVADIYDSAYKSAVSVMLENSLKIALLKDDLDIQKIAIDTIKTYSTNLKNSTSGAPWFLRSFIGFKKEYIALKATKQMFQNKKLPNYPFIMKNNKDVKQYLACKIDKCFSFSDKFDVVNKDILKEIKE